MRPRTSLHQKLLNLRPQLADVAQDVYDNWYPDDEDCPYGDGGICDDVATRMAEVIGRALPDVQIEEGGQEGDDHAFLVVYDDDEAFNVDIPPGVYERGGGYSWTKIEGVTIQPSNVVIEKIPRSWIDDYASRENPGFPVPSAVQAAAKKGLDLHKEYGRGGTNVGLTTARRLARGGSVPLEGRHGVRHIARYFPRHAGDNLHQKSPPSNGYIAWLLWGGDAGRRWSEAIVRRNSAVKNPSTTLAAVEAWMRDVVPIFVKHYIVEAGAVKVCSIMSPAFAFEARRAGFDCYVVREPGHVKNVFKLDGAYLEVDLTSAQFEVCRLAEEIAAKDEDDKPFDPYGERRAVKRLVDRAKDDPFSMIKTKVFKTYNESRLEDPAINESQHVPLDKLKKWYS